MYCIPLGVVGNSPYPDPVQRVQLPQKGYRDGRCDYLAYGAGRYLIREERCIRLLRNTLFVKRLSPEF